MHTPSVNLPSIDDLIGELSNIEHTCNVDGTTVEEEHEISQIGAERTSSTTIEVPEKEDGPLHVADNVPSMDDLVRELPSIEHTYIVEGTTLEEEHISTHTGSIAIDIPEREEAPLHAANTHPEMGQGRTHVADNVPEREQDPTHATTSASQTSKLKKTLIDPILTTSSPGGPNVPELLVSFEGHIAYWIWKCKEHAVLTCHTCIGRIAMWPYVGGDIRIGSWAFFVHRSKLSHLGGVMFRHINMPLLSAFVERWHPETNSFHMPWGEMTVTLHDVLMILQLPIHGRAVIPPSDLSKEEWIQLMAKSLSITPGDVKACLQGSGIKFDTIYESCNKEGLTEQQKTIGYLLYLLGSTLFIDKSQDRVSSQYIQVLVDLDTIPFYAWGSATLAYLYR